MRSDNVLVFRTARTLRQCLERFAIECPAAQAWIVHTPGCESELNSLGIDPEHRIAYRRSRFLTIFKFLTSRSFFAVIRRRYRHVVVLYSDNTGNGYAQIDAIARILAGRRAVAFLPDGDVLEIPPLAKRIPEMVKTLFCTSAARIVLTLMVDLPLVLKRFSSEVSK